MDPILSPEAAEAVHKAKGLQQAVEVAREVQKVELADMVKASVVDTLQAIFSGPNSDDPEQMSIIHNKIPILCMQILAMKGDIAEIKSTITWAARGIIMALLTTGVGLIVAAAMGAFH